MVFAMIFSAHWFQINLNRVLAEGNECNKEQ